MITSTLANVDHKWLNEITEFLDKHSTFSSKIRNFGHYFHDIPKKEYDYYVWSFRYPGATRGGIKTLLDGTIVEIVTFKDIKSIYPDNIDDLLNEFIGKQIDLTIFGYEVVRKILFLDIDGVMNDSAHYAMPQHLWNNRREAKNFIYERLKSFKGDDVPSLWAVHELDYDNVLLLNRIVRDTECKIVISSAWRSNGVENVALYLAIAGFRYPTRCIDVTPRLKTRGEEIQHWLDNNKDKWDTYAILDDEMHDIYKSHGTERLFKTDGQFSGLTPEIADKLIKYLNGEE